METAPAIDATGLGKRFGRHEALRGVDLRVQPGEIVGLLGPNGAGKSTFVKLACGLAHPTSGTMRVFGGDPRTSTTRTRLGYLAELFRFPPHLRPDELLADHQALVGSMGGEAERTALLERVNLADDATRNRRLGEFSKGMQQRLGIAQALVGSPRLVLLDEPTSALDPASRHDVRRILDDLRSDGVAVLLNSHLLGEVERTCDRVVIIRRGELVADGTLAELERPSRSVVIETDEGERTFEDVEHDDVPALVERLIGEGRRIHRVQPLGGSLEEAYLDIVGEDRG
jgi:ABC-2 type transport system ATP-binding protein